MNIPFRFTLTNTNTLGVLWNPYATVIANSAANATLAAFTEFETHNLGFDTLPDRCIITGIEVVADTAASQCSLGYWSTGLGAFVELSAEVAEINAGGGIVRTFYEDGILAPFDATRVPCLKLTGASTSTVFTGNITVSALSAPIDTVVPGMIEVPTLWLIDEAGGFIQDENANRIIQG